MTDRTSMQTPHAASIEVLLAELHASPAGLTSVEANARLAQYGRNELPTARRRPLPIRILVQFNNPLIYVLIAAAVATAVIGDWLDFGVIVAVIVVNAVIGFVQEDRAERAIEAVRGMLSTVAAARRDGGWQTVPAAELVPGDIVRLLPGDKVPADVRLIEVVGLRVDESALTGESVPAEKSLAPVHAAAPVGDRSSMAFSGTIVTAGQARAVVTSTGRDTQIGAIQSLVHGAQSLRTPLTRQLDRFALALAVGVVAASCLLLVIGRVVHLMAWAELIPAAVGFAVAGIAEELPPLVTIILALGVQQMARRRAIARTLTAVETLGAVTTICTDKTGTLTKNEMTVRTVVTSVGRYDVTGAGYAPEGEIIGPDHGAGTDIAVIAGVGELCSEARLQHTEKGWRLVGEPTEGALAVFARKAGVETADTRRLGVLPFDATRKYMATAVESGAGERALLVKGAPDRLLERADRQSGVGGPEPIDTAFWTAVVEELSDTGLRVLAAARRPVEDPAPQLTDSDVDGLEFLGVWGILDPPRTEAVQAIAECHAAGIDVKMITGDHIGTALAIARDMGIVRAGGVRALTGADVERMTQDQLAAAVPDTDVFARTSPEHKLRIVRALQSRAEVVAMTGDGVNDAPALRQADVGVAMGIKGTEATKEAADLVLADDNFATIRDAVHEGRRTHDNLRKAVVFLLPTNAAQALVILTAIALGLALMPLTAAQVLWVNLITSVSLSLTLAYEPAEYGVMTRPPRRRNAPLISPREVIYILAVAAMVGALTLGMFYLGLAAGRDIEYARTQAVATLTLAQLAYLLNCRFLFGSSLTLGVLRGNRILPWSALLLIMLQAGFTYLPFMNSIFGSRPLSAVDWIMPVVASVVVFLIAEALKRPLIGRPRSAAVTVGSE